MPSKAHKGKKKHMNDDNAVVSVPSQSKFQQKISKFRQMSVAFQALVFVVVFGLIGSILLLITHAGTISTTFTGKLAPYASVTRQVTSGGTGQIAATASFSGRGNATLQLIDSTGVTVASAMGKTPLNVSTAGVAGTYSVKLQDNNSRTRGYTITVTYPPANVADTTAPSVPTGLSATVSGSDVLLSWAASTDSVGVTGYNVSRNGVRVGSSATTSFTDKSLLAGSYAYTISAYDAAGNTSASTTSVSATVSAPVVSPTGGTLSFDGRFTTLGTFANNVAPPTWPSSEDVGTGSQISVYESTTKQAGWPDPYKWSNKAAAFTSVNDGTHTSVRSQVHGAPKQQGTDFYYSWAIYIPSSIPNNWPTAGYPDWVVVQQMHGPPYNGSPAVAAGIDKINNVVYLSGHAGWTTDLWKTPVQFDSWMTVVQHIKLSKDPTVGINEVWVNGVKQSFDKLPLTGSYQMANYNTTGQSLSPDGTTAHIATMLSDSYGTDDLYLNNYRIGQGSLFGTGSLTIFHAGMKVGNTYADVAP